jgi:hypothetical protein
VSPIFLVEGLADLVAFLLTNRATYVRFATGEKVNMAVKTNHDEFKARKEAANGYFLLRSLYGSLGAENFWSAVREAKVASRSDDFAFLHAAVKWANDPDAIDRFFKMNVEGYS